VPTYLTIAHFTFQVHYMAPFLRFLPLLVLIMTSHAAHAETVMLGVLEDLPGVYAGESNSVQVRVLFKHTNEGWSAFSYH